MIRISCLGEEKNLFLAGGNFTLECWEESASLFWDWTRVGDYVSEFFRE
jgi:hypothetical protein